MKKYILLIIGFFFLGNSIYSQCSSSIELNQNNITTTTYNNGQIFWNQGNEGLSIFASGLWIAGFDPAGNLKLSATTYNNGSNSDYEAGPLNSVGIPFPDNCENYSQFWQVYGHEIEQHLQDFNDNGFVDNPIQNVFGYPAHGNSFFESYYGFVLPDTPQKLAPFFDANNDGIYTPHLGDYPLPTSVNVGNIPAQIVFSIFNDTPLNLTSQGQPLRVEVQYTAWVFNCLDNPILNNTIFTNHKIINRAIEQLDSVQVGIWIDHDIGCYTDDLIGSSPEHNAFYAYNRDATDGTIGNLCNGVPTVLEGPPAISTIFLNHEMSHFMGFHNPSTGNLPPAITDPTQPDEFLNYMTGAFRDGTPLTYGESGYNTGSTDFTDFAFPAHPADSLTEWTMHDLFLDPAVSTSFTDARALGSIDYAPTVPASGGTLELDLAFTMHKEDGLGNIENVNLMYDNFPLIQQMYDEGFDNHCDPDFNVSTEILPTIDLKISPNPANDFLNIDFKNESINQLSIFDTYGNVLFVKDSFIESSLEISTNNFPSGVYFIFVKKENVEWVEKFVVVH